MSNRRKSVVTNCNSEDNNSNKPSAKSQPSSKSQISSVASVSNQSKKTVSPDKILEACFRNKNLSWETVDGLIGRLNALTALDLSHNRIDSFPNIIAASLTALDLSYNSFTNLPLCNRLGGLTELRLRGNHISDTTNLGLAANIKYLDLSFNAIQEIRGLESMTQLAVLHLEANDIRAAIGIRSLCLNKQLTSLYLADNPISVSKPYGAMIANLIPSLVKLDGTVLPQRRTQYNSSLHGYEGMFVTVHQQPNQSASDSDAAAPIDSPRTLAKSTTALRMSAIHLHKGSSSTGTAIQRTISRVSEHFYDGSGMNNSPDDVYSSQHSSFPWRDPPHPMPRPWKGKHIVGSPVPRSPQPALLSPRTPSGMKTPKSSLKDPNSRSKSPKSIQFNLKPDVQHSQSETELYPSRLGSFKQFKKSATATTLLQSRAKERCSSDSNEQWLSPTLSRNQPCGAETAEVNSLINRVGLPKDASLTTEQWSRRRHQIDASTKNDKPPDIPKHININVSKAVSAFSPPPLPENEPTAGCASHPSTDAVSTSNTYDEAERFEHYLLNLKTKIIQQNVEVHDSAAFAQPSGSNNPELTFQLDNSAYLSKGQVNSSSSSPNTMLYESVSAIVGMGLDTLSLDGINSENALASISSPAAKPLVDGLRLLKSRKVKILRAVETALERSSNE